VSGDGSHDPQRCGERVLALTRHADRFVLVAPFITRAGLAPILDGLPDGCSLDVFTRWRADEVAAGASDPGVLDQVEWTGGQLRLHHMLHAKAYVSVGTGALVGSANATATGLGWASTPGVELLVATPSDDPSLVALLSLLEATSAVATDEIRQQVLTQARAFPVQVIRETVNPEQGGTDLAAWLPSYSVPRALWKVYSGERGETVTRLAQPDLDALDIPAGLDEAQFNAYIGSALIQGLPGLAAQRLSNLSTYQAVQGLTALAAAAGVDVGDSERRWNALAAWVAHFLPDAYHPAVGGRALHS
jgi:hypothetical protein